MLIRSWIFVFLSFLLCSNAIQAKRGSKSDSLRLIISSSGKDSTTVLNYLLLAETESQSNLLESQNYANKGLHISKQIGYPLGKAKSLKLLGDLDVQMGKLHLALSHYKQALLLFEQIDDPIQIGRINRAIGNTYSSLGDMIKAIEHQQNAVKFFTENRSESDLAHCYSDLGKTHYLQKNHNTALRYYKKAKNIYQKDSIEGPIAELYNRISLVFREMDQLDRSLEYDYLALMTQEKQRDKQGIANSNYNIGKTSILQGEIKRAKGYIDYAVKLYTELQDNIGLARCYILLAKIDVKQEQYNLADEKLDKSIAIAKESGAVNELSQAYYLLSEINKKNGDHELAYKHLKSYLNLRDTIYSDSKSRQFSELEVQYRTKNKDKLLHLAQEKEADNKKKFLFYIVGASVICLLLLYIIWLMRNKNKAIKEANFSMESSNELIRLRNKEIIDSISYARKIQEAILTPEAVLNNIFSDHFVYYKPKDIVSGDFYWAHKDTASNKVFWVTADCTGHGVPGALMSVIGTVVLNEIVLVRKQHDADKILNALSKYLKRYLNKNKNDMSQDGIELTLCVLDRDNNQLFFSGANRNLYIVREKELIVLKGNKRPIGYDPFKRPVQSFTKTSFEYQKGDCIYAFTDGYTDQIGGKDRKKYRLGVFKQDLKEMSGLTMSDQKQKVENNQQAWLNGHAQLDDILVIGVKI